VEGPPLTVPCPKFRSAAGPSPSGKVSFERKKNTALRRRTRALNQDFGRFKTTLRTGDFQVWRIVRASNLRERLKIAERRPGKGFTTGTGNACLSLLLKDTLLVTG
jgi:hypothetical protein